MTEILLVEMAEVHPEQLNLVGVVLWVILQLQAVALKFVEMEL